MACMALRRVVVDHRLFFLTPNSLFDFWGFDNDDAFLFSQNKNGEKNVIPTTTLFISHYKNNKENDHNKITKCCETC